MHFKSDWQKSFESETFKEDFQRTFGGSVKVDMMYGDFTNLGYSSREANNGAAQIVAIPFEDENYHMVLVLPSQERGNRGKIFSYLFSAQKEKLVKFRNLKFNSFLARKFKYFQCYIFYI